ncbi:neurexin-4-like [Rhopilema esculentum]|uniref:neurexin-4-like n=1 Tax=Rhopilema esculentum TaxID=499914 RepID=UPI0031E18E95
MFCKMSKSVRFYRRWTMLPSVFLYPFFLSLNAPVVASSSFFMLEKGDQNGINTGISKMHFRCDRDQSCAYIKFNKVSQEFQLLTENYVISEADEDTETVWRKVLQIYPSCKEALPGDLNNGVYWIQHKNMQEPIKVKCNREIGNVLAVFDHDSESRIVAKGFEIPGSYRHRITYTNRLQDLTSFVDSSRQCHQFTRIDCFSMSLYFSSSSTPYRGYLVDRSGNGMEYFGGGPTKGRGCSCGITGTCAKSSDLCNCYANDAVWRFDEGFVTDNKRLPITEVRLGDTGHASEEGAHTIGKLICEEWP